MIHDGSPGHGSRVTILTLILGVCGCGDQDEAAEHPVPVALDQVPKAAMTAATQAVPGIKVNRAQKVTLQGQEAIEIIGKTKEGKIREVEVTPAGKVLAIE
ncbi:MAG TPA: hypothetical protein VGZ22_08235 [Isosphaeraceae bacterium]|jgi:hypothetical protein|nr:hypothetical protein [Isosphaeraceae bacterium]